MPRLARALEQLRSGINGRYPHRDKASDGTIGNAAHQATPSDHNPNAEGVICAYDLDCDIDGTGDDNGGPEWDALMEHLRTHPHPNIKYLIDRDRMFSAYPAHGVPPFTWRPYTKGGHGNHAHISVGVGPDGRSAPGTYDDTTPWLTGFGAPQPPQEDDVQQADIDKILDGVDGIVRKRIREDGVIGAADPRANGSAAVLAAVANIDIDETELAKAIAPLVTASIEHLTTADLDAVAKAVNDELARRQTS